MLLLSAATRTAGALLVPDDDDNADTKKLNHTEGEDANKRMVMMTTME